MLSGPSSAKTSLIGYWYPTHNTRYLHLNCARFSVLHLQSEQFHVSPLRHFVTKQSL